MVFAFRTCPNDLKEAVASVLYASKRLSDVAELADVVKHFSAKYGKDFVSAAVGLHSDSGVSRLVSFVCVCCCRRELFLMMMMMMILSLCLCMLSWWISCLLKLLMVQRRTKF